MHAAFIEQQLASRSCLSIVTTGVRILPGTELARQAVAAGVVDATQDLTDPVFYPYVGVDEEWILTRINSAIVRNGNVVHSAEGGESVFERVVPRILDRLGVAPPYWRFLPAFLRLPPLPFLRKHFPQYGSPAGRPSVT